MHSPNYSEVVAALRKASMPVRELGGRGKVAAALAAGRVIAMAFNSDSPNLFWSHPYLGDSKRVEENPGGMGGDRLWFSPEFHYNWKGVPDWQTFSNYVPPTEMDPGSYEFVDTNDPHCVQLRASGALPVHGSRASVDFELSRTIQMTEAPLPANHPLMHTVDYVGIETSHVLRIGERTNTGLIALWHLLQMPTGSVLIVPLNPAADERQRRVTSYGLPGAWVEKPDHIMWCYGGTARAKLGLSAAALTGRSAVLRELSDNRWCMIVREFPFNPNGRYCDHPHGQPRTDQAFQAWDGFGFGEMEFHSLALDAENHPRELKEVDRLWAFGAEPGRIAALAAHLLKLDVSYVFGQ